MSAAAYALGAGACLFAGIAGALGAKGYSSRRQRAQRRAAAYGVAGRARRGSARDANTLCLQYAAALTRKLYAQSTTALAPSVRAGRAESTRAGMWFEARKGHAGCSRRVGAAGFCEARMRMGIAGVLAGALLGTAFSTELGILAGLAGGLLGATMPRRAIQTQCRRRAVSAQRHLSEMLEVVALGLRSGLTFDRSFELYGSHFDNPFALSCAKAHRSWSLGLVSREEALRSLADSYDCEQLGRIVDAIVRNLRFGTSLTAVLEEAAAQSRDSYRAELEERVAKAPVKMMLPTGTLILPAMLLLVMGPILLELASGF